MLATSLGRVWLESGCGKRCAVASPTHLGLVGWDRWFADREIGFGLSPTYPPQGERKTGENLHWFVRVEHWFKPVKPVIFSTLRRGV